MTKSEDLEMWRKRAEAAERTVASIATMLGWGNVPPQETLERDIKVHRERMQAVEKERDELRVAYQLLAADLAPGGGPMQAHAALQALKAEVERAYMEFFEWQYAYVEQKPLPNGEHAHLGICSGNRRAPAGSSGCVCDYRYKSLSQRVRDLEAQVARYESALKYIKTNTGDSGIERVASGALFDVEAMRALQVPQPAPQPSEPASLATTEEPKPCLCLKYEPGPTVECFSGRDCACTIHHQTHPSPETTGGKR